MEWAPQSAERSDAAERDHAASQRRWIPASDDEEGRYTTRGAAVLL